VESPFDKVDSPGERNATNNKCLLLVHQKRMYPIFIIPRRKISSLLYSPAMTPDVAPISGTQPLVTKTMSGNQLNQPLGLSWPLN